MLRHKMKIIKDASSFLGLRRFAIIENNDPSIVKAKEPKISRVKNPPNCSGNPAVDETIPKIKNNGVKQENQIVSLKVIVARFFISVESFSRLTRNSLSFFGSSLINI